MSTDPTVPPGGSPVTLGLPRSPRAIARHLLQVTLSLALAVALLGWGLPKLTDTTWTAILGTITSVGWPTFFMLLGLMFLGLYCYTFTLMASLPGLTHGQALMANLSGSGVSNLTPGGGALGAALTYGMFRSWRFTHRDITSSIIVTSVWNVLARVILPVLAASLLLGETEHVPDEMVKGALGGGAFGAIVAAALIAVVASPRAARAVGRACDLLFGRLIRRLRHGGEQDVEALALEMRGKIIHLVRTDWLRLTLGLAAFMGVYFLLFRQCLEAVGVHMSWRHAFAAYAVGRLLTTVALTPGGVGLAEGGAAAVMLAMGAPGEQTAAAVTLFALYTFLLEIPFGAVAILTWLQTRGRYLHPDPAP